MKINTPLLITNTLQHFQAKPITEVLFPSELELLETAPAAVVKRLEEDIDQVQRNDPDKAREWQQVADKIANKPGQH